MAYSRGMAIFFLAISRDSLRRDPFPDKMIIQQNARPGAFLAKNERFLGHLDGRDVDLEAAKVQIGKELINRVHLLIIGRIQERVQHGRQPLNRDEPVGLVLPDQAFQGVCNFMVGLQELAGILPSLVGRVF